MRSFRLDRDSAVELLDSWPALVIGVSFGCLFAYVGIAQPWGRAAAVILFGVYGGFALRGAAARRLQEEYPEARWVGLLSVGMMILVAGVTARMAFPQMQGTGFDLAWLGGSFFPILAFVLVNRKDKQVTR